MRFISFTIALVALFFSGCRKSPPEPTVEDESKVFEEQHFRASELAMQGKIENALIIVNNLVAKAHDNPEIYVTRGIIFRKKGDFQAAIKDLDRAIELQPNFAIAHCQRGLAYQQSSLDPLGDKALADAEEAIKIDPTISLAHIVRGNALRQKNNPSAAIEAFNQAIKHNPDSWSAYSNRAGAYVETQEFDKAQIDLETALSLDPPPHDLKSIQDFYEKLMALQQDQ